jgi:Nif-specific regulatory protein
LREKKEDIPVLTEYFLRRYNDENGKSVKLSPEVIKIFMDYDWPGNVRELENTIERLVVMSKAKTIGLSDIPINIRDQSIKSKDTLQIKDALPSTIENIEKARIIDALNQFGGNQAKAARILGITPRQIGYKIKKYKI